MKIDSIKYRFIIPLAVFLTVAAWVFLYMAPANRKINMYKEKLAALAVKIKQDVPETLIQRVENQTDSLSAVLDKKRGRIFPMADFIRLGPAIQAVTDKYDLVLVALKPDYQSLPALEADTAEIAEFPMTLAVKGKFTAFTKFADNLTALPFVLRADDFRISRPDKNSGLLNIEIKGVIFLRKAAIRADSRGNRNEAAANKM